MINQAIASLVQYAVDKGLIAEDDRVFSTNALLERMKLDSFEAPETLLDKPVNELLDILTDDAVARGLCEDDIVLRDLFDTGLMSCLTPRPSEMRREFRRLLAEDPKKATDWYYAMSGASNYIRWDRIHRNMVWKAPTEYGELDITINLTKPEKATTTGAAFKAAKQSAATYPKCLLCVENEGYAGRYNHPARQNHRIMPFVLDGEPWFVASDVCRALDIRNSRDAFSRLEDDEKGVGLTDTPGGKQKVTIVNEPGLYSLIMGSRKPEARAFKHWITHEVIPSIRKHGAYMTDSLMDQVMQNPQMIYKMAEKLLTEHNRAERLNKELQAAKPKAAYFDAFVHPGDCTNIRNTASELGIPQKSLSHGC